MRYICRTESYLIFGLASTSPAFRPLSPARAVTLGRDLKSHLQYRTLHLRDSPSSLAFVQPTVRLIASSFALQQQDHGLPEIHAAPVQETEWKHQLFTAPLTVDIGRPLLLSTRSIRQDHCQLREYATFSRFYDATQNTVVFILESRHVIEVYNV